jgi:hypothetical protein
LDGFREWLGALSIVEPGDKDVEARHDKNKRNKDNDHKDPFVTGF